MPAGRSPVAWYGGKSIIAPRIVDLLPHHTTYIEAFGGGASVLFTKPRARLEVYNDAHDGLVTFFRVLRDQPDAIERVLRLTPYSRSEFELCRDTWHLIDDDVERARRWYVRSRQAFGCSATVGWGFEIDGAQRGGTRARGFAAAVDQLDRFAARLRGVQVERADWRVCLDRHDVDGAVFYLDPPYHPDTRGRDRGNAYEHDLTADDHLELVERVQQLRASVLLSAYPDPSYDVPLAAAGFERIELAHYTSTSRVLSGRGHRTEIVWRRLEASSAMTFDHASAS